MTHLEHLENRLHDPQCSQCDGEWQTHRLTHDRHTTEVLERLDRVREQIRLISLGEKE